MTRPQKDSIEVLAEGPTRSTNFALIFDRERVGISGWYDLDADPSMELNLAPLGQGHAATLFHTVCNVVLDGKKVPVVPGPPESITLIENLPERVVIAYSGPLVKLGEARPSEKYPRLVELGTGRVVGGDVLPNYEIRYTIYPTGMVYVQLLWDVHGTALPLGDLHAVLANAPTDQFTALNDSKDPERADRSPVSFVLHHGKGPLYRSDALFVPHFGGLPSDWLGQRVSSSVGKTGWFRSAFCLVPPDREMPQGQYTWSFLVHLEPGTAGKTSQAMAIAEDYRHPATLSLPDPAWGKLDLHQPGDSNSDGFSERDGTYNLIAGHPGVRFSISAKTGPRHYPVFRVADWTGLVPESGTLNGKSISRDTDFSAFVVDGVLVLQYFGVIRDPQADFQFTTGNRP